MEVLDLARWQFGITTVYHFILVPLTIGLSPLVALMQTKWLRSGDERWLRLSEFFGKILVINFALGVATGIVQEFQFGMNWSQYSISSAHRSHSKLCSPSSWNPHSSESGFSAEAG